MARADREAVLRGVNARFDEAGDDDAVIKALGSPTFAAVTVLRGYTPPEEPDDEDYAPDESEYVAPSNREETEPEPEVVEAAPEAEVEPSEDEAAEAEPDAEYEVIENIEAAEAEPIEAEPADYTAAEAEIVEDAPEAPVDEATIETEPEAETSEEPVEVPADEAASEPEPDEPAADEADETDAAPARTFDTVDIGFGTIEVYSDGTSDDENVSSAPVSGQPVAVAEPESEPEAAEETAEPEVEPTQPDDAAAEAVATDNEPADVDFDAIFGDKPAEEPVTEAKLRGGRVFLVALLTLIPGVPVAAVLAVVSLALLAVGAALIYTGGVIISFAFLGMSVAADIMLCAGAGLFVAALGLPVVFFAVWFFLRCFVRLYSRTFARAGEWCRGEVRK